MRFLGNHHLKIAVALFALATVLYIVGLSGLARGAFVLGCLTELLAWTFFAVAARH